MRSPIARALPKSHKAQLCRWKSFTVTWALGQVVMLETAFSVFWSAPVTTRPWILQSGCFVGRRMSGSQFGLRCNLILTRIFTLNFNAAVKPEQKIKEEEKLPACWFSAPPKIFQRQFCACDKWLFLREDALKTTFETKFFLGQMCLLSFQNKVTVLI